MTLEVWKIWNDPIHKRWWVQSDKKNFQTLWYGFLHILCKLVGDPQSNIVEVSSGVPQGSILQSRPFTWTILIFIKPSQIHIIKYDTAAIIPVSRHFTQWPFLYARFFQSIFVIRIGSLRIENQVQKTDHN